jgi:hypothetical protein
MELIPRDRWTIFSHWLILHGRRICVARRPRCSICPLACIVRASASRTLNRRRHDATSRERRASCRLRVALVLAAAVRETRAQEQTTLLFGNESVAANDFANGWLVNPATVGVRYPSELLVSWADLDPGTTRLSALMNAGGFGLGFVNERDGLTRILAGLAGGRREPATRVHVFLAEEPTDRRSRERPEARRAHATVPLAVARRVAGPRCAAESRRSLLRREYVLGIGLRPLAFNRGIAHTLGTRVTFTADARLRENRPRRTRSSASVASSS